MLECLDRRHDAFGDAVVAFLWIAPGILLAQSDGFSNRHRDAGEADLRGTTWQGFMGT